MDAPECTCNDILLWRRVFSISAHGHVGHGLGYHFGDLPELFGIALRALHLRPRDGDHLGAWVAIQ